MTDIVRRLVNGIWTTEYADAGGGGGSAAGDTGQIQYNDADAFAASGHFVWSDAEQTLKLVTTANGLAQIIANGLGVQLHVLAGDGDAGHTGGEMVIESGASAGGSGGDVTITAGSDSMDGNGGNVTIASGSSAQEDAGSITISANLGATAGGDGGSVLISAGSGDSGGYVSIQSGGPDGGVEIFDGASHRLIEIGTPSQIGFFGHSPAARPTGVAVDAAAIHAALVTLGLITA